MTKKELRKKIDNLVAMELWEYTRHNLFEWMRLLQRNNKKRYRK